MNVKGRVPFFFNGRYTKGLPFPLKMGLKGLGLDLRAELNHTKL